MSHCCNFWSRFQGTSSTAASPVLLHDVHCNFGRIKGLWEPVSWVFHVCRFMFILLTPTQEQLETVWTVTWIFSNMKIVPQVFLGIYWSGHCCWAVKYPQVPFYWWNLVFLWLLRLSIFENNKFCVLRAYLSFHGWSTMGTEMSCQ